MAREYHTVFIKQVISLLLVLLFNVNTQAQHKYYFAKNKKISKDAGTRQQPFASLQQLLQLTLKPGDTVFFHAGDTIAGNILLNSINGTAKHNIVFTSYGRGKAFVNGGNKEAFAIAGSNYFQILNLALVGSGRKTGNTTDGLRLADCSNLKIRNLDISGFQKSGLTLFNCEAAEVDNVFAHQNGSGGILVEGDYKKKNSKNIYIVNCQADNNPGDPTKLDNHSGSGILVGNCKNVVIEYCSATNNGWDMPRIGNGPVGIWAYQADSVIIQHCISYRNKTAKGAADGGGFDLDGGVTNSVIQYCLSYENWGSGYGIFQYNGADKWFNNTLRYCISINDGQETEYASAMLIWNGENEDSVLTNFYAYHNFFYNEKNYVFGFLEQSRHKNFFFLNNVFVASDTSDLFHGIDSSANDVFMGNVWMKKTGGFSQDGFHDLETWAKATGYEQQNGRLTGISFKRQLFIRPGNINITDPYSLKTNSVLRSICQSFLHDKGIDIRKMFSIDIGKRDFFGHVLPLNGSIHVGACAAK
jgi:hypothetical protein